MNENFRGLTERDAVELAAARAGIQPASWTLFDELDDRFWDCPVDPEPGEFWS